jgi:hypothetical protein
MHDSIYFVFQASHSSQAPGPQWTGGSPAPSAPTTWPPPPLAGFWPPWGTGFWCPPVQPYPGQPRGHTPPQPGGHPLPLLPWGSPPGGHVMPSFGSRSVEITAALTYDFHSTHGRKLLRDPNTRPFRTPNRYLYMSFRAA